MAKSTDERLSEVGSEIDPELAKEILETKEEEERAERERTRTVRITHDVWDQIAKHGKFGETVSDVLRRIFDKYGVDKE